MNKTVYNSEKQLTQSKCRNNTNEQQELKIPDYMFSKQDKNVIAAINRT